MNVAKVACAFCVDRQELIDGLREQLLAQHTQGCVSCVERQALVERTLQHLEDERVLLTLLFAKAIAKRDAEITALRGPRLLTEAGPPSSRSARAR